MSINGIGNVPPSFGSSPADVTAELIVLLRQARQAHRESENGLADAAVGAAMDRARHAQDKAEAVRNGAYLQFALAAGSALFAGGASIAKSRAASRAAAAPSAGSEAAPTPAPSRDPQNNPTTFGLIADVYDPLAKVASAADDAFGWGHEAEEATADMEQDSAQEALYNALRDRTRNSIDDIQDALSDARQVYRELNNG